MGTTQWELRNHVSKMKFKREMSSFFTKIMGELGFGSPDHSCELNKI